MIYFIQGADGGPVKIGHTGREPLERLRDLQCGSPVPLVLRATVPGNRAVEDEWHERFASDRLHGEWFRSTPELAAAVRGAILTEARRCDVEPILSAASHGLKHGPLTERYQAVLDVMTRDWQWIKDAREKHAVLMALHPSVPTTLANTLVSHKRLEGRRRQHLGWSRLEYRLRDHLRTVAG